LHENNLKSSIQNIREDNLHYIQNLYQTMYKVEVAQDKIIASKQT